MKKRKKMVGSLCIALAFVFFFAEKSILVWC